jgi:hypothetical protein
MVTNELILRRFFGAFDNDLLNSEKDWRVAAAVLGMEIHADTQKRNAGVCNNLR